MLNFKVLTNIALQIPPWATWLLFFFLNNFENKGYSSGKYCAKVNDVSERTSVQSEQTIAVPTVSSEPRIGTIKNACYDV